MQSTIQHLTDAELDSVTGGWGFTVINTNIEVAKNFSNVGQGQTNVSLFALGSSQGGDQKAIVMQSAST